jgi:chorismate mutase-like protein
MTSEAAAKALAECRQRINALDQRLIDLLNERTRLVEQIGRIKQECKMPIYEPKREEEVLRNVQERNAGPMPQESARRIFERIIDEMRTLQHMRVDATRDGGTE